MDTTFILSQHLGTLNIELQFLPKSIRLPSSMMQLQQKALEETGGAREVPPLWGGFQGKLWVLWMPPSASLFAIKSLSWEQSNQLWVTTRQCYPLVYINTRLVPERHHRWYWDLKVQERYCADNARRAWRGRELLTGTTTRLRGE